MIIAQQQHQILGWPTFAKEKDASKTGIMGERSNTACCDKIKK